jgi:hypothetical protein
MLAQLSTADKINLFNAFGAWIAAIGTISAVIIALYLARLDRIIRVKLSVGHRMVGPGSNIANYQDYCSIKATNIGSRKVTITGVGWKVGFFKKRIYEQILSFPAYPSTMPITVADGEEATWFIPFNSTDEHPNWIDTLPLEALGKHPKILGRTLKIFVYTSVGKQIIAPIEKSLRDKLINAALRKT